MNTERLEQFFHGNMTKVLATWNSHTANPVLHSVLKICFLVFNVDPNILNSREHLKENWFWGMNDWWLSCLRYLSKLPPLYFSPFNDFNGHKNETYHDLKNTWIILNLALRVSLKPMEDCGRASAVVRGRLELCLPGGGIFRWWNFLCWLFDHTQQVAAICWRKDGQKKMANGSGRSEVLKKGCFQLSKCQIEHNQESWELSLKHI